MRGERKKKLNRAQAQMGIPAGLLAEIYKCSLPVIRHVVNNEYKNQDNVGSDEDYLDDDLPADHTTSLKTKHLRKGAAKKSAPSHSSTKTTGESTRPYNEEERRFLKDYFQNDTFLSFRKGSQKETLRSSQSVFTPPTPLTALAVQKRRLGGESNASLYDVFKAAQTEEADTAHRDLLDMQFAYPSDISASSWPVGSHGGPNLRGSGEERHEMGQGANNSAAQPAETHRASASSPETSRLGQTPAMNGGPSDNQVPSATHSVVDFRGPSSLAGDKPTPSRPTLSATAGGNMARAQVASFLSSQKRDLSRLLPTFVELGIKDDEDMEILRSMSREENKKWFDELAGQGKLTPFEAHILLCALHNN